MRNLKEIVDEAYDIFTLAYNKFEQDKRWKGNFHYDWVGKVAEISEKLLVNERISSESKSRYESKQKQDKSGLITIRLKDGKALTRDVNTELKKENFKYSQKGFYWYRTMKPSSWDYLKNKYPFDSLTTEVVEK